MSLQNWLGNAVATKDQWTLTIGGTWAAGDTITLTALSKTLVITFQTGYLTLAAVAVSVSQAYNSQPFTDPLASVTPSNGGTAIAEFGELTAVAGATTVTLTATTAGKPMPTFSVSKSSVSGTVSIAHTTTATGPNFWDNAANWTSAVPVTDDDVVIDRPVSILYGLAQSGVTLSTLTISPRFDQTCALGLPSRNPLGYEEWRATELAIGATTVTITTSSGLIKINFGSVQTAVTVYSTGSTQDAGRNACQLRGSHAANVLNVLSYSSNAIADVGWAANSEAGAVLATVRQDAGTVTIGQNVTLTTFTKNGGTAHVYCAGTTLSNSGDTYLWSGAWTTVISYGGTIFDLSAQTITTLTLNNSAVYNSDGNVAGKTITNCTMNDSTSIVDTAGRLMFTTPIARRGRITVAAA